MLRSPRGLAALRGATHHHVCLWLLSLLLFGASSTSAPAASIRSDGLLEVDGSPMFPIGLLELGTYVYPDWEQRIQASGANLVWDIEIAYADTTPGCAEVLRASEDGDWYLMIGSGDTWNWDDLNTPEFEVDQLMYETAETNTLLDCVATSPNRVIAMANRDEPVWTIARGQVGDIDEPHVRETYGQLRQAMPGAVVGMNFAPAHLSQDVGQWKADIASYSTATDVMMFAAYPYPQGPGTCGPYNVLGYPECTMDRLPMALDIFLAELNDPGQPLWAVVQAFKDIPLKEARWQAAASVIHGATGILWAGWSWWHDLGHGIHNWPVTQQVMSEYSALQSWLVGKDIAGATTDHPDVEVRVLRAHGTLLAFAISRNGYAGPATLQLPRLRNKQAQVVYEDRIVQGVGGSVTDTFDAYEAHIYRYDQGHAASMLWHEQAVDAPELTGEAAPLAIDTYPNPSAGRTTVRFSLPQDATTLFTVFDTAGRRVAVVGRGSYPAGTGTVVWDGRDLEGAPVAPGAYFIRATTSRGETATARVLIRR